MPRRRKDSSSEEEEPEEEEEEEDDENDRLPGPEPEPLPDGVVLIETQWVQCEKRGCKKWRKVHPKVSMRSLAKKWSCDLNHWDKSRASCAVDEDTEETELAPYPSLSTSHKAGASRERERIAQEAAAAGPLAGIARAPPALRPAPLVSQYIPRPAPPPATQYLPTTQAQAPPLTAVAGAGAGAASTQQPTLFLRPLSKAAAAAAAATNAGPQPAFPLSLLTEQRPEARPHNTLAQDLEDMLFGFGDSYPADQRVVSILDRVVQGYMKDLAVKALRTAAIRAAGATAALAANPPPAPPTAGLSATAAAAAAAGVPVRLDKEAFLFAVRRESAKFSRAHRLLAANDEIKGVNRIDYTEPEGPTNPGNLYF